MFKNLVITVFAILTFGCSTMNEAENLAETSKGTEMPNLKGVSMESAEQIVLNNNWIPIILEEASQTIPEGQVTRTKPAAGQVIDEDASVSIFVSKGPSVIYSKNSLISWSNISSNSSDEWNFEAPYISNDKLKINLVEVSLSEAVKWRESQVSGVGIGRASITDTFDKTVPINFYCGKCQFEKQEIQKLDLEIPLGDLNESQPTQIYLELYAENMTISLNFNITW
jgi:hypothetical protein